MTACGLRLSAQGAAPAPKAPPAPPPYQSLRYDEDWSYLKDPTRRVDFWDAWKYIPINERGGYLSLGGEARERYEGFHNSGFGAGPQTPEGYLLQRYLFHSDLHLGKEVRFFFQMQSGIENGRNGGPRATDMDKLEIHQAFVDFQKFTDAKHFITLRLGRQEFEFGTGRMIAATELLNVRTSFDGARVSAQSGPWTFHGIVARPVEVNVGLFDDSPDHRRLVWGVGAVRPDPKQRGGSLSLYYIGLDRKVARFDNASGRELRHTVGGRFFGVSRSLDYNNEVMFQWGSVGSSQVRAWAAATDTGYTMAKWPLTPRFGARSDFASGGSSADGKTLNTFNPLFPGTAYSGKIGLLGPSNILDVNPSIRFKPIKAMTVAWEWGFFWRESLDDGIYGTLVQLLKTGHRSRARFIANQPDVQISWILNRHLTATGIFTRFQSGQFIEETPPSSPIGFATIYLTYRF